MPAQVESWAGGRATHNVPIVWGARTGTLDTSPAAVKRCEVFHFDYMRAGGFWQSLEKDRTRGQTARLVALPMMWYALRHAKTGTGARAVGAGVGASVGVLRNAFSTIAAISAIGKMRQLLCILCLHELPVHQIPERFHVLGTRVAIVHIVRVLPHVARE